METRLPGYLFAKKAKEKKIMSRVWVTETVGRLDEVVEVKGWVMSRRDHGKLIFIDLRDRSGLLQVVFKNGSGAEGLFDKANTLRSEYVVAITGKIQKRGERQINPDMPTGTVELVAEGMEILAEAETPVFEIEKAHEV